ncbi:ChbG/HpnK family deacetylase [Tardiphaga sp. 37S4]|uniref:ChbG/HpnK family deacetylase n=1 Tax=Tardiphaga sp. 37S4 TaxID=1404741 RepID=UPI000E73D04A|nr:ChbG/HpnK family deacetylase [Tardiphaga sp. 37S4]UFS74234.1 ChbG/HpnK family deacetylase [Tardiphaga sp. 37S4]
MTGAALRRITLCADDYGISPGVNQGIRELIALGRLNATSVMVVGPAISRDDVSALQDAVAKNPNCEIGLHATLTAPFHPLTMHYRPLLDELFLPLGKMLRFSLMRKLDREAIETELTTQIAKFVALFGRAPDYVDGHQHVQTFPQVRDALLAAVRKNAPQAWVRQSGRVLSLGQRLDNPKALLLDTLSATFRRRATGAGVTFNPGFAGAYDFTKQADFGALMAGFLNDLPDGGLVMCHPGHVDEILIDLDPFTDQREREYQYLASDAFVQLLAATNVTLAR